MFVPEACQAAIIDEYAAEVIACPTSRAEWRKSQMNFWNFPHVCGALDGKYVACKCPPNTGSTYHNYEGFLMALVDADYNGCLPSESVHCLVIVWSLSDRIRENPYAVGTDSVVFLPWQRYKSDQNRIENGMIGTNSAGNVFTNFKKSLNFQPRITGFWSDFWHILIGNGPIKDGSKNPECVT
jgi:hypothetical protein